MHFIFIIIIIIVIITVRTSAYGNCQLATANEHFAVFLLLIYCLEIFFGFTCAQDSSAPPSPSPFSCCVANSGILALVQPAHEFILKIIYCICCFRFCLLSRSHTLAHTLPAKSQNFLIALFVSTAAVVVAFVCVIFLGGFFFLFHFSMLWRHVRAFIFP